MTRTEPAATSVEPSRRGIGDIFSAIAPAGLARVPKGAGTSANSFNVATHGLRGIAALFVLFAHILGGTAEHIYAQRPGFVSGIEPFWNLGTFGVPIFFAISGFVITPSALKYPIGEFAIRRFIRIYPLFIATTILFALLNLATNQYPEKNNILSFVYSALFLDLFTGHYKQIAPNAWSLSFEVMFYALAAGTTFVLTRNGPKWLRYAFLIVPFFFVLRFPRSFFFLAGALIYWIHSRGLLEKVRFQKVLEVIAFVACVLLASWRHFNYHFEDLQNPIAIATFAATALYFAMAVGRSSLTTWLLRNPITLYLGTISYSFYLVHPYTYLVCRRLFSKFGLFSHDITLSIVLFSMAVLVTSVLASHFVHLSLERWPYQRFFRQRIYTHVRSSADDAPHKAEPTPQDHENRRS